MTTLLRDFRPYGLHPGPAQGYLVPRVNLQPYAPTPLKLISEHEYCPFVCTMLQCRFILKCNPNAATDHVDVEINAHASNSL